MDKKVIITETDGKTSIEQLFKKDLSWEKDRELELPEHYTRFLTHRMMLLVNRMVEKKRGSKEIE